MVALLFISFWSRAQQTQIDSLKNILEKGSRDTSAVNTLNLLSLAVLSNEDIDKAIAYAMEANDLADDINYDSGQALAQKYIGLGYFYQGNYLAVMDHWNQSLESYKKVRDTSGMANILNNLGGVYLSQGGSDKALDYYLQSLYYAEKVKDTFRITSVLPNIGAVYGDLKDYDKALEYFQRMEKYLPGIDNPQITTYYYMGVGEIYNKLKKYDLALEAYQWALPLTENTSDYAHILKEMGMIENALGNRAKAIDYLTLSYRTAKEKNQQLELLHALIGLGEMYKASNYSKAVDLYNEAESLAIELETNKGLRDIYRGLSETYASKGDYNKAYTFQTLFLAQKDSIYNKETDDKIRGLQFDFENQQNQDKIGLLNKEKEIATLQAKRQKYVIYGTIISLILVFVMAVGAYSRYKYVKKTNKIIEDEKDRSEKLLLNILPEETARELKEKGKVAAKRFESVTILFSDFKGFTSHAQHLNPEILVKSVDYYFSRFDEIMDKYGLEKIKTVGDAYMCAGGLPFPTSDHPFKMIEAAIEMAAVMEEIKIRPKEDIVPFDVRIGINTGTVVAGVVGLNKFAYDIWGDAVNVASRMETKSEPGRINISENTYEIIKNVYDCEFRGEVEVKNKGKMSMYFVKGRKIIRHAKSEKEVNA
ncbi:tetratricopeptide repeat protein [Muriicola soli]|uniref:Adenylate cyclase n=2 Tax=Muriicola soli TaxID=2507538 RepID=A0A411ECR4_9FLAO|nr:tetratricopeptide repeat protein [Muriicola soli]